MSREQFSVGELTVKGITRTLGAQTINILLKDKTGDVLVASGLVVPTDSNPGFAKGALFIDTNVVAGTSGLYQNVGTNLLCNFDRVDSTVGAGSITLATGSMLIGVAGVAAAIDGKADGAILIGNGSTMAAQTLDTDVTMTNTGAVTIANNAITTAKILDANVTAAKLADGAGVAAILTAGLGGSQNVIKTDTATKTIVAAHATKDRAVLVVATVTEAFATGNTSRTMLQVGEDDTVAKLWDVASFPNAMALGTVIVGAFTNLATKKIIATAVAAAGTGTGGASITAIAIPTT